MTRCINLRLNANQKNQTQVAILIGKLSLIFLTFVRTQILYNGANGSLIEMMQTAYTRTRVRIHVL